MSTNSEVATLSRWRWRGSTAHGYAPESAGWTDRLLSDPAQVRVLPGAHAPAVRLDGRRATNAEVGGSNPLGGTRRERSSTEERRPRHCGTPVPHLARTAPRAKLPRAHATRVRLPPLAPRRDPCSRKHLVRLPGCLPGEAGSIPVGGARPESAWRNWHTRRAQASLLPGSSRSATRSWRNGIRGRSGREGSSRSHDTQHAWVAQLGRGSAFRTHPVRVRIPLQVRRTNKQKGGEP